MKTLLEIGSDKKANSEHTLLLEVGKGHCCMAFLRKSNQAIDYILLNSFNEFERDEQLLNSFMPLKQTGFESVVVCSAFPQSLLYPAKLFTNNYAVLDQVYEEPAQDYFHDKIPEWQIINIYSLPKSVSHTINESSPSAQFMHTYTPAIKIYNGFVADCQMSVHFAEQYFKVLLKKDTAIHLAQTYSYKTPLDVIYYLLKICYEFGLSQQEVYLILSGLVEKSSNLYVDLQQYFTHIHFAQQPEISLPQSPHPHYYFTSIYNLAACVL